MKEIVRLEYGDQDKSNICDSFAKIMENDLIIAKVKCNPDDLKWLLNFRGDYDNDDKRFWGAEIIATTEMKKSEIVVISN